MDAPIELGPESGQLPGLAFIKLRGLPFQVNEMEIRAFLRPCRVPPGGILFIKRPDGRMSGEALVALSFTEDEAVARAKTGGNVGSRAVTVSDSSYTEADLLSFGGLTHPQAGRRDTVYAKNMPYMTRPTEVVAHMADTGLTADKVWMLLDPVTGRASGQAFFVFPSEDAARAAVSKYDRTSFSGRCVGCVRVRMHVLVIHYG